MPRKRKTRNADDNDNNWTCALCTLQNPMRRRRCGACEAHRPLEVEQPSAVSSWLKRRKRKRRESSPDNNSPSTVAACADNIPHPSNAGEETGNPSMPSHSSLSSTQPTRTSPCSRNQESSSLSAETSTELQQLPKNTENEQKLSGLATSTLEVESAASRDGEGGCIVEAKVQQHDEKDSEAPATEMETTMDAATTKGELYAGVKTAELVGGSSGAIPAEANTQEGTSELTCESSIPSTEGSSSVLPERADERAMIRDGLTNQGAPGKATSPTVDESEPRLGNATERTETAMSETFAEQLLESSQEGSTAQANSMVVTGKPTGGNVKDKAGNSMAATAQAEAASGRVVEPTTVDTNDATASTASFTRETQKTGEGTSEADAIQQQSSTEPAGAAADQEPEQPPIANASGQAIVLQARRDSLALLDEPVFRSADENEENPSILTPTLLANAPSSEAQALSSSKSETRTQPSTAPDSLVAHANEVESIPLFVTELLDQGDRGKPSAGDERSRTAQKLGPVKGTGDEMKLEHAELDGGPAKGSKRTPPNASSASLRPFGCFVYTPASQSQEQTTQSSQEAPFPPDQLVHAETDSPLRNSLSSTKPLVDNHDQCLQQKSCEDVADAGIRAAGVAAMEVKENLVPKMLVGSVESRGAGASERTGPGPQASSTSVSDEGPPRRLPMFTTALGKKVDVSEESLSRAALLLSGEVSITSHGHTCTAGISEPPGGSSSDRESKMKADKACRSAASLLTVQSSSSLEQIGTNASTLSAKDGHARGFEAAHHARAW